MRIPVRVPKLKIQRIQMTHQPLRERKISCVAYLLAFYFFMVPFDALELENLGSILKIFSVVLLAFIILNIKTCRVRFDKLLISLIVILMSHFLSLFYTVHWKLSIGMVETMTLNLLLVIAAGGLYRYTQAEITMLKRALIWGGVNTILMTLIFGDVVFGRITLNFSGIPQDPNYLSGYLMMLLPFFTDRIVRLKKKRYLLPMAGVVLFVLFTGSRGGLITITAVTGFTALYDMKDVRNGKFKAVLAAMAVLLLLLIFWNQILSLLPPEMARRFTWEYISQKGTTGRLENWKALLSEYANAPALRQIFGHGSFTSYLYSAPDEFGLRHVAHNIWIDQLINLGAVGLLLMLYMQWQFLKEAIRQKDPVILAIYLGYLLMSAMLSLTSYKPMWNCMMIIMIVKNTDSPKAAERQEGKLLGFRTANGI